MDTWPNIGGGGQAYCFEKITSCISVVLEHTTIVFQNIGGPAPHLSVNKYCTALSYSLRGSNKK